MKITSSTLVNIILSSILLTSTLFIGLTTTMSDEYDPWKDLNDDGYIELMDFWQLSQAFGTSGNPTKQVIIAECNWSHGYYEFLIAPDEEGNLSITTAGYKQITLGFKASKYMQPPTYENVSIATGFLMGTSNYHVYLERFNATPGWTGPELPTLHEFPVSKTYDIRGQTLTVAFYNPNNDTYILVIEFYITT